jgi:DNA-binding transcriptional MerR regulator
LKNSPLEKSSSAFRTISEVAEELDVPKHVLRFWEGKFPQLRPMKRGGGRRYYRPEDIELLRGIRWLLYSDGYTIKGVQRILRDNGVKFVKLCWRDSNGAGIRHDAEPNFEIPNLAADAANAARRPRGESRSAVSSGANTTTAQANSRAKAPEAQPVAPPLRLTREQKEFLQSLLRDLEACRTLLQHSVELAPAIAASPEAEPASASAAKPKARSRKRPAAEK